jgi:hypothetical protein
MLKNKLQSRSFRIITTWILLFAIFAMLLFISERSRRGLSGSMEWLYLGIFWLLLIGYRVYRIFLKKDMNPEEIQEEEKKVHHYRKRRINWLRELMIFVLIAIAGIYFTAWIIK